jgi:hypothetical protein
VSIESPKWAFPSDTEDVAIADPVFSMQHGNVHYRIMKRHVVQVRFSALANGLPNDVPSLLRQVAGNEGIVVAAYIETVCIRHFPVRRI